MLGPILESPEAPLAVTETPEAMIGAWKVPKCRPRGQAVAAEDSRVVAVMGTPEALGPRLEDLESLARTAEAPPTVTETPEAVETGIPEGPTS